MSTLCKYQEKKVQTLCSPKESKGDFSCGENKQDSIGKLVTQIFQQVNFLKGLLPSALFHLTKRKLRDFTDFQELFSKHCVNSPQTLKKGTVNNE